LLDLDALVALAAAFFAGAFDTVAFFAVAALAGAVLTLAFTGEAFFAGRPGGRVATLFFAATALRPVVVAALLVFVALAALAG